jgi:hypothetical protein
MKSVNSLYDPASHTLTIVANDPSYNSLAVASNSAGQTAVNGFAMTSGSSALNAGDVQSLVINEGAGQDVLDLSGMTPAAFASLQSVSVALAGGGDSVQWGQITPNSFSTGSGGSPWSTDAGSGSGSG